MKKFQILILFISGILSAQSPTYSVDIIYNIYATDWDQNEYLYRSEEFEFYDSNKINQLVEELRNAKSIETLFAESKIDTVRITQNPESLLKYYDHSLEGRSFRPKKWNSLQKEYITEKLRELSTYKEYFYKYLTAGCCVHMHDHYRAEFIIRVFENYQLIETYTSRKSRRNTWKFPWTDSQGNLNYNPKIDNLLFELMKVKRNSSKIMTGKKLMRYLVTGIVRTHSNAIYKLSAQDYAEELNELESDFTILETGEVRGVGRYAWSYNKTYYARLTNEFMLPRVNMVFMAEKRGKSIYSRDSIKSKYPKILERVQSIDFLTEFLKENPDFQLDIYFFDNKPINDYNIEGFNKSPEQWVRYDEFLEMIKRYENEDPIPGFANEDAIRTKKSLYAGCNYRFERDFVEQAIFIELKNEQSRENSIWYLLPDDTVLLYLKQGEKILNYDYTEFVKFPGLDYPCVLFDLKGNILDRR